MSNAEIVARNLTAVNYGEDYKAVRRILEKLTEAEIDILMDNCYVTAEKGVLDAFEPRILYED